MMHDRIPVETREPIATFGVLRVGIALAALAGALIFQVPHTAALSIYIVVVGVPWAAVMYLLSTRGSSLRSPCSAATSTAALTALSLIRTRTSRESAPRGGEPAAPSAARRR